MLSRDALVDNNTMGIISKDCNVVINQYLYYYFVCNVKLSNIASNANPPSISAKNLGLLEIMLPPLPMQQQIVSACEAIDKECQVAHQRIEDIKAEMEQIFHETKGESIPLKSLISFGSNRIDYSRIEVDSYISTDNMLQQYKGIVNYKGTPNINTVISYQQDDILISNIRPYLKKIWLADREGGCSPDVLVLHKLEHINISSRFIYYSLRRDAFFDYIMSDVKGMKMPRGKKQTIENYRIIVPQKKEQDLILKKMDALEKECLSLQKIIDSSIEKKQAILDKYLK